MSFSPEKAQLKKLVFDAMSEAVIGGMSKEEAIKWALSGASEFCILADWKVEGEDYFDGLAMADKIESCLK